MLTKPFKPLALAFLVNLIISVENKIKYKKKKFQGSLLFSDFDLITVEFGFVLSLSF